MYPQFNCEIESHLLKQKLEDGLLKLIVIFSSNQNYQVVQMIFEKILQQSFWDTANSTHFAKFESIV
jgi:hypothetical protein